jgi:prolyl oligopeptidase
MPMPRNRIPARFGSAALVLVAGAGAALSASSDTPADPHRWLEEIDGPRALAWVAEQNERTKRELAAQPGFEQMRAHALSVLNSGSRIPTLSFSGRHLYNLWKSEEHPRGLFRRTTLDELKRPAPAWTTVLDVDELSRREGKPWVFKSMSCLPPERRRCLVALSAGGGDAIEIREFDSETLRFVEGGFFLPAAKSIVDWIDQDTLFVATDFGEGSLTESGYPRIVKVWRRGTPLASARTVFEADRSAVRAFGHRVRTESGHLDLIEVVPSLWSNRRHLVRGLPRDPVVRRLEVPETASLAGGFGGRLVLALQDDWAVDGRRFKAGSVVIVDPSGRTAPELIVEPTEREVIETEDVVVTDRGILVPLLDSVRGRLDRFTPAAAGGFARERIRFPDQGALAVMTANDEVGEALVTFETFLTPPTLYHVPAQGDAPTPVMSQAATFDGSRFEVSQQWATSKDGTRIPYFLVGPKEMKRDGTHPVHIFSYGGFRSTLKPSYSGSYEPHYGAYGKLWLERGGVFVLANIRGGGEFGPRWHSSVLKENRHKVYEDFEAVADDLVRSGVTRARRIGIEGRSNGGLLTLTAMNRRPELYGAVIAGVPLSDMQRYHEMLAGASWMAEYGDPRIPSEWSYIREYSPYQNFRREASYPPVFVFASTRDDRVHPGHARKTVARLQELGHRVWYYENVEGGHGGSSTNDQLAYRIALSYAHLWRALGTPAPPGDGATLVSGQGPGWRALGEADFVDVNGTPETWTWHGGLLRTSGVPIGVLRTRDRFANLEMVIEWRHLQKGGNSGVFVWVPDEALRELKPDALPEYGIEVQMLDHGFREQYEQRSGKKGDWFTTHGDIFAVGQSKLRPFPPLSPDGSRSFPREERSRGAGEWNHYYVRAVDGEVRLWVNGQEVSGGSGAEPRRGYLCLEAEGAPVEFRTLRIRELP